MVVLTQWSLTDSSRILRSPQTARLYRNDEEIDCCFGMKRARRGQETWQSEAEFSELVITCVESSLQELIWADWPRNATTFWKHSRQIATVLHPNNKYCYRYETSS